MMRRESDEEEIVDDVIREEDEVIIMSHPLPLHSKPSGHAGSERGGRGELKIIHDKSSYSNSKQIFISQIDHVFVYFLLLWR